MSDTITPEQWRELQKQPSKYQNRKTEVDNVVFDSKAEADHYAVLKLRERAGEIEGLVLQPRFPIEVNGMKICTVVPDFLFWDVERQEMVVQDTKSHPTKTRIYRLKKKLMKACHDIDVEEV